MYLSQSVLWAGQENCVTGIFCVCTQLHNCTSDTAETTFTCNNRSTSYTWYPYTVLYRLHTLSAAVTIQNVSQGLLQGKLLRKKITYLKWYSACAQHLDMSWKLNILDSKTLFIFWLDFGKCTLMSMQNRQSISFHTAKCLLCGYTGKNILWQVLHILNVSGFTGHCLTDWHCLLMHMLFWCSKSIVFLFRCWEAVQLGVPAALQGRSMRVLIAGSIFLLNVPKA